MNLSSDRILKVAVYCRVSTDNEDQQNSLESQQKYFKAYIARNPLWEFYDAFVDEGISGTSTKKRKAFNRMIVDAQLKKFDLIITKEISRFARNTLDSILYTRQLKELGIGVIFANDNLCTLDPDAELRLTLMASIAQEESRKTSERVKWGQKRRMEQGVVFGREMLGYDLSDGKLYVNHSGARIVEMIFHKYVIEQKGTSTIARELNEDGIQSFRHTKWTNAVILKILRNEKYCGDLIQKKTITPNYLTHEKVINQGQEDLVVIRNHHDPIISRELFDLAQLEIAKRSGADDGIARLGRRYCFSGKIRCAQCGHNFVYHNKKAANGNQYKFWECYNKKKHGKTIRTDALSGKEIGCDMKPVPDKCLKQIMQNLIEMLAINYASVVKTMKIQLSEVFGQDVYGGFSAEKENAVDECLEYAHSFLSRKEISDEFIKSVVEEIVVHANKEIVVKLELIPDCWIFTVK